ncbi:Zinc finger BED domain-containing protein 4 [Frankliniella fusca]|uniref:Zinc finger BED domain-containing protein 4 n=1 Tax=Frankliniella fusca TaxID=407009 RepID=A0AAE1HZU6_9NEOP|nr:Zinc finger BED domain-containing protein 4 [Frankliniella fusca]
MAPPKSDIWKYWNKHGDKKEKKAQCKTCFKIYASSNGTTNLWKHSASHGILRPGKATADGTNYDTNEEETDNPQVLPDGDEQARARTPTTPVPAGTGAPAGTSSGGRGSGGSAQGQKRTRTTVSTPQATLEDTIKRSRSFQEGGSRSARLEDALLFMVVKDNLALSTPEKEGFRYFAKEAVPLWTPISRKTLTSRMEDKYESLHRVVSDAMAEVETISLTADCWTDMHSNNITFSHTSNLFSDALKRVQREQGRTEGTFLRLTQEVPTRWNSGYLMIDKFIEMFGIIALVSMEFPDLNMVTNLELQSLRVVRDLLRPFHLVTAEMSAEKVTTASKVIPLLHILTNKVSDMVVPPTETVGNALKTFLLSELHRRFKDVEHNMPLAIATLLDPRFMKMYFKQPIALARTMSKVEDFVKAEIRREATEAEVEAQTAAATQTLEAAPAGCHGQGLWGDHDTFIATRHTAATSDDPAGKARIQLRSFLDRAPAPRSSNPLTVWEGIKQVYPQLYKLARRYLSILATSVPCERQFSHCGAIMDDQGSRLTPTHLSHRVFLGAVDTNLWRKNSYSKS